MKRNNTKAKRSSSSIYDTRRKYAVNVELSYNGGTREYEDAADYLNAAKLGALKARRLG